MPDHFGDKYGPYVWDRRILERRQKRHELSPSDLKKYLKELPEEREHQVGVSVSRESDKKDSSE